MKMKKKHTALRIIAGITAALVLTGAVYCTFGGFGTGSSADAAEFAKYASDIASMKVPKGTRIVALGEATHGNREFQELKLDVFRLLVEKYGVRAFALEGDFGSCEYVDRYIHGEVGGTARDAAAAIGFAIYRTDEMAALIEWMRDYNDKAGEKDRLRFYGFDMQRYEYNYRYLISDAKALGVDVSALEAMWDGDEVADGYTNEQRTETITAVRDALLACGEEADFAVHHADILLQNIELGKAYSDPGWEGTALRDKLMAQNIMWISAQEEKLGHECIFVSGHNGHIERNGTYNSLDAKVTGHFLADELGSGYFAVGTDFYRATVNLPGSQKRITRSFYSWDPVAKAAKNCGGDMSYLDFSLIPEDSSLRQAVDEWGFMGSLGESYSFIMKLFPYTYRVWRSPSETYDAAIYVPYAHPTEILPA